MSYWLSDLAEIVCGETDAGRLHISILEDEVM